MNSNISFIIPCFNCSATIEDSVQSIVETNMEAGDEIIFIDDSSTDDTYNKLVAYREKYPFVKIAKHHINKGTAAAGRNTGIDIASNELIFCLDADNILHPESIKKLKNFLLANRLDAAAFGRIDYFKNEATNITDSWIMTEKLNFIDAINNSMKTPCGSGNYLYTKAIWKQVNRYNESLGGAYDSEIFGLKLLAEEAKFWTLTGTAYLHRQGYESTFIKEYNKRNTSLLFLAGLIEYWDKWVHAGDIDYIFGEGRLTWMENIEKRPLRSINWQAPNLLKKISGKLRYKR